MPIINKLKNKQQGLSLIELLIIISLIALLAILLIPKLIQTKNTAQEEQNEQQIINNLHTIKLNLEKFHYNLGYYPVYNFPLPNHSIIKLGTLQEILTHYSQLNEFFSQKISNPERYYYYAPANTKLSTTTPFYPPQNILNKTPTKGASQFIIIYNGDHNYYKLNNYSSNLTIQEKKEVKQERQKQLLKLFNF